MTPRAERRSVRHAAAGRGKLEVVLGLSVTGVLMAVAFDRLSQIHDPGIDAQMETLAANLQTAVSGFQAHWKIQGRPLVDVAGWGDGTLDANSAGFAVGSRRDGDAVAVDQDCEDIWLGLLVNPPPVTAADPARVRGTTFGHVESKLGTGADFVAGQDDVISDAGLPVSATPHREICQFISLHYQSVTPGTPKPTIFYDSRNGSVYLDLTREF